MHAYFSTLNAFMAFLVSDTCSDFLVAPSPVRYSQEDAGKPLDELPVMAQQTKKSSHLCVVRWWVHSTIAFRFKLLGWTPSFETQ